MVNADDLRSDAPLLDTWLRFQDTRANRTSFTTPGHKYRLTLAGRITADDVPHFGGLGTIKGAADMLAAAEARAASAWGADFCRFSVAGSTHGNQALALAVARPGSRVIVARTLHRSMLLGLVLAGLEPVWVCPQVNPRTGMPDGIDPTALEEAFTAAPDAAAVFIGDPSYVGTLADIPQLARIAHHHGVPLVVDAAWAAYFGFHPQLPAHAIAAGADALVTSAHKTLPAWTQGAMLLAHTKLIDSDRLNAAFDATNTTSPSGTIYASIDASRSLLEHHGTRLISTSLRAVRRLRRRLARVDGLMMMGGPLMDPLKVALVLSVTGANGNVIESELVARGLPIELADRDTLVPIVSIADDQSTLDTLGDALIELIENHRGDARPVINGAAWSVDPVVGCPPREAFFAIRERVPLAHAVGRICAELIAPYPPGIPVLSLGEVVTPAALDVLGEARRSGTRIAYASDPTLATVDVIASDVESR
jgi:arginine decarboxylase